MAKEIERKFLVRTDIWSRPASGTHMRQGYLRADNRCSVRVRVAERHASLTIKASETALTRHEYEYEIPRADAEALMAQLCGAIVEKTRYHELMDGHRWEIDVFHGANDGLAIAEIELASENEAFATPSWLGKEVSGDPRYFNANLAALPYSRWNRLDGS